MPVVESKLKTGSLILGGTPGTAGAPPTGGEEFACQATNVRVVPSFNDEGDNVETLCGDTLAPSTTTTWALQGTHIQDWDTSGGDGVVQYSWAHNLETVGFYWKPNASAAAVTGEVQVRALEMGGDVNTRLTTDFDWPISGTPAATWPTTASQSTSTDQTSSTTKTSV